MGSVCLLFVDQLHAFPPHIFKGRLSRGYGGGEGKTIVQAVIACHDNVIRHAVSSGDEFADHGDGHVVVGANDGVGSFMAAV